MTLDSGDSEFLREKTASREFVLAVQDWVGVWGKAIFKIVGQSVGAKPQTADRVQQEHLDLAKFSALSSDWLCLRYRLRFLLSKHIHGFLFFWN